MGAEELACSILLGLRVELPLSVASEKAEIVSLLSQKSKI